MQKTTGVLLLILVLLSFLLLSAAGCVFPEYESEDINHTTSRITYTTGRVETESEADSPDPSNIDLLTGEVVNVRSFVHIRAGAGLDEEIISTAQNGAQFPVSQVFYDDNWHEINYEGQIAYIHADYFDILSGDNDLSQDDQGLSDSDAGNGDEDLTDVDQDSHADSSDDNEISEETDDDADDTDDPIDQNIEGVG